MKRIRWVALWMTLVLALQPIGCRKDPSSVKITSIRIGVTVYDQYDVFISQMMTVFNEYATRMTRRSSFSIGNWWRRIWNAPKSFIMSVQARWSRALWRAN